MEWRLHKLKWFTVVGRNTADVSAGDLPSLLSSVPPGSQYQSLQITLVDCPGHASLIKTIIGGAHACVCVCACVCVHAWCVDSSVCSQVPRSST